MNDHGARAHSIYGASGAHRWMACPGSVKRCQGLTDDASPWAKEGTQAHELLEAVLNQDQAAIAERWAAAPEDMRAHVGETAELIWAIPRPGEKLIVEQGFELPSRAAPGEVYGTADVVVMGNGRMDVADFKYGAGIVVEVERNKQLMFYALGAYLSLNAQVDEVKLTIIQPRAAHSAGPVRSWSTTPLELLEFAGEIETAIVAAQQPDAPLVPGMKQCQFCRAAPGCPAREAMMLDVGLANAREAFAGVKDISPATLPAAPQLPVERIAHILRAKSLMLDYFEQIEAHAFELMQADPNAIPGFKLVEARDQRRYTNDEDTTADMLWNLCDGEIDREEFFERKLLALTNAEKVVVDYYKSKVKRGMKNEAARQAKEAMAYLTTKSSSGKLTIAPLSDDRPAANRAQQSFEGVSLPMIAGQVTA